MTESNNIVLNANGVPGLAPPRRVGLSTPPTPPTAAVDSPEVAALKAEIEALKAKALGHRQAKPTMKVSEKGGLSVYGMGRWPVTLYMEQWIHLLEMEADIRQFIKEHKGSLRSKADETPEDAAARTKRGNDALAALKAKD